MNKQVNDHLKLNNYFEYRRVTPEDYKNFKLPLWIKSELGENKSVKILDYGCGFGQLIKSLIQEGYKNVYGVDIADEAIEYCQSQGLEVKKVSPNNVTNPWNFKFDIIICLHVIEHIPKERIIDTLKKIRKIF